jgi:hypothetical protein
MPIPMMLQECPSKKISNPDLLAFDLVREGAAKPVICCS